MYQSLFLNFSYDFRHDQHDSGPSKQCFLILAVNEFFQVFYIFDFGIFTNTPQLLSALAGYTCPLR